MLLNLLNQVPYLSKIIQEIIFVILPKILFFMILFWSENIWSNKLKSTQELQAYRGHSCSKYLQYQIVKEKYIWFDEFKIKIIFWSGQNSSETGTTCFILIKWLCFPPILVSIFQNRSIFLKVKVDHRSFYFRLSDNMRFLIMFIGEIKNEFILWKVLLAKAPLELHFRGVFRTPLNIYDGTFNQNGSSLFIIDSS